MRSIVCGVLMALTITTAGAEGANQRNSAIYMLPYCKVARDNSGFTPRNTYDAAFCAGMVNGLSFLATEVGACLPAGVNLEQAMHVVIRYIETRPQRMHESFKQLALEAMQDAWPCKR